MVLQSDGAPPGGSSFGGTFHKDAFNSSVYPKPGARRTEREEHRSAACHHDALHKSAVLFTLAKEQEKPSRLRKVVTTHNEIMASKGRDFWADAKEKFEQQEKLKVKSQEPPTAAKPVSPPPGGTWCPHPSLLRGSCRLNRPRALDWGIDLDAAPGWNCPFWDAPRHRFEGTAALPEAKPVTPTRSLRWRNADDWDNPDMHAPWKITHTIPKSSSMVELTRRRMY
jgi:hypothetical protein